MTNAAAAAAISKHLAAFTAELAGTYTARVVTGGEVPYLHVVSQLSPELWEDVLCDFSTDPPGYLTAGGHRLGTAGDPAAAALALAWLLTD